MYWRHDEMTLNIAGTYPGPDTTTKHRQAGIDVT